MNPLTTVGSVREPDLPVNGYQLYRGDALDAYRTWPTPTTIISDGAYGVGGFFGDPRTPEKLTDWYRPHVEAWAKYSHPSTTLWFWNTEVGWATVHPLLVDHGWEYVEAVVWDKGIGHIAGNVNGDTIRRFPVVSEVCVFYRRLLEFPTEVGMMSARQWLRHEWRRAGIPLYKANEACGVKNAATRKYLTQDWLWYFPPPEMMSKLVSYANLHGRPSGRPYYSIGGSNPVTEEEWASLRHRWSHQHGLTNVWSHPPVSGSERLRGTGVRAAPRVHRPGKNSAAHLNQKPIEFMKRIVLSCTDPGDVVWEPFGGLCTATLVASRLGRFGYAAERVESFADLADSRLTDDPADTDMDS